MDLWIIDCLELISCFNVISRSLPDRNRHFYRRMRDENLFPISIVQFVIHAWERKREKKKGKLIAIHFLNGSGCELL